MRVVEFKVISMIEQDTCEGNDQGEQCCADSHVAVPDIEGAKFEALFSMVLF